MCTANIKTKLILYYIRILQPLLTTLTNPLGYLILNTFHYFITNSQVLKDIHLVKAEQYFHGGERLKNIFWLPRQLFH